MSRPSTGDRAIRRTGEHTRAKPRALPARPRPCHPAHTRPIVLSNDPPNAGAAAKIFFCSRAPFARPVVRRGPAHPTPTPAPPPRAPRPNPVAGASFPTSRLRAQRRGSIGRRSKPPRLRDRAEHRDDFCLLGAHPAEHGARSGRSQSPVPVGTHIGRRTRPRWVWVGVQSRGPLFGRRRGGRALAAAGPVPELALDLRSALGESDSPRPAWWVIRCWGPPGLVWVFAGGERASGGSMGRLLPGHGHGFGLGRVPAAHGPHEPSDRFPDPPEREGPRRPRRHGAARPGSSGHPQTFQDV